jgi:predicted naringenin-chalcone synthase
VAVHEADEAGIADDGEQGVTAVKRKRAARRTVDAGAAITGVGVASPPLVMEQAEAGEFLAKRFAGKVSARSLAVMRKVFSHASVKRRHFAVESPDNVVDEDPDQRIGRFTKWAVRLSAEAARKAMAKAGVGPDAVEGLIVNTCTGYVCPGISTYLIEELALRPTTQAYDLVGAGCGGAIPNVELGTALAGRANGGAVVSVSVEICSATFQMGDDVGLIVSNALFSDGAGACVIRGNGGGLRVAGAAHIQAPEHREAIRYVHKGGQLHNQLSLRLPEILKEKVGEVVRELLDEHGLRVEDVEHWAIHPGGDKVIAAVKEALGLSEEQLAVTREVLAQYGNVSSATVWFEMDKILGNGIKAGDLCVMVAAGAGLSVHAMLLVAGKVGAHL